MDSSFGEGYISQVQSRETEQTGESNFTDKAVHVVTVAGDVAMGQLGRILIALNGGMLLIIPPLAWFLTRRTLQPIEEAFEKQKQFVSDASHELRTPLTVVQGELDVALKKDRPKTEYRRVMESSRQEVAKLRELVEALLLEAKTVDTTAAQFMDDVDLADLLTETVERMKLLATTKGVSVNLDPPTESATIVGSSVLLGRLFLNVLENALKMTPAGGHINVSFEFSHSTILTIISDDGPGMDPGAVAHAFDRFYQADNSRAREGFGLGLAICKTIAEQHGGSIKLASKPGRGTTVSISLPRKPKI